MIAYKLSLVNGNDFEFEQRLFQRRQLDGRDCRQRASGENVFCKRNYRSVKNNFENPFSIVKTYRTNDFVADFIVDFKRKVSSQLVFYRTPGYTGIRAHTGPREFQSRPQKQLTVCFVHSPVFRYTGL